MTTIDTVTAAPETTIAPVTVAIDDGPVTPDADGRSRGWRATVIVSPTERRASLFTAIGSGVPADVWHNRVLSLAVNTAASGEAVRAILEDDAAQAILADLCDQYEGDRWDGHNHVGRWPCDEGGTPDYLPLIMRLEAMIAEAPCYSSAADWCSPAWSECKREVEAAILGAKDADAEEAALTALVDKWATDARDNGALIDAADLRKQVDAMAEELAGDLADDETLYVVEGARVDALRDCDLGAVLADVGSLGETWCLVEATSEIRAARKARTLRAQGGAACVAEVRRLGDEWTCAMDGRDGVAALVAALPT
jgi:hypothetical protein